jgi:hypothetical protein
LNSNGSISSDTIASEGISQSFGGNKTFLYSFTVSNYSGSGGIILLLGGWCTPGDPGMWSNGYYEFQGTPYEGSGAELFIWALGTFVGSIDNISIKEITSI